jgi:hypothetical protein
MSFSIQESGARAFKNGTSFAPRAAPRQSPASPAAPGTGRGGVIVAAADQEAWEKISTDELATWKQQGPPTPLLDTVNFPIHIKNFNPKQLQQLCKELRAGAPRLLFLSSLVFSPLFSHFSWSSYCFLLSVLLNNNRSDSHGGQDGRPSRFQLGCRGAQCGLALRVQCP